MLVIFSLFCTNKIQNLFEFCFFLFHSTFTIFREKSFKNINGQCWKIKTANYFFLKSLVFRLETSFNYIWKILRVDDDFHGTFQTLLALHITHANLSNIQTKKAICINYKTNFSDDWQKFLCIQILWGKKFFFRRPDSCPKTFIHTIKVGNQHLLHTSSDKAIYM